MIVEERDHRIHDGRMAHDLRLAREAGLAIRQPIAGRLVGSFTTEVGPPSQVRHLRACADLEDRARRQRPAEDPRRQAFPPTLSETTAQAENRILPPTGFSPLR
ncbi:hypothetical protein OPKNFCMD_2079 [Methylobacterium crusticola]|uniref:NIPSNAP domain-containing protein n=1 Tax=Methylobacterium crusticola TaxID=1697972 RepID=A0ABQ4QVV6_9HYPH|nr:NIPSNAP family protein [Methylobacterium crusticola]GJD49349.1 hypothetical protein OPKNFCMD_2079 [Methylobacterium crusticola]